MTTSHFAGPGMQDSGTMLSVSEDPMLAGTTRSLRAIIDDPARLAAVRATGLLDTPREEAFDRLTRLAAEFLNADAAFFSVVDAERDFYKSHCGFAEPLATQRELGGVTFCHYAIQSSEPLVISDTAGHVLYQHVPTVETLGVAAYVGIPLLVHGQPIGALCAIGVKPRTWTERDVRVLGDLAAVALDQIQLRAETRRHAEARAALEQANRELKEAKESADRANRAKADFLAHMSHELRTPLNSVIGFANVLCSNASRTLGERELKYAERIAFNGKHLLNLVNRVLDLAKVERGGLEIERSSVRVDELARSVYDDFSMQAATAGVQLTLAIEPAGVSPAALYTDEGKLRQVLINLVANAIKFTPAGGRVQVLVACDPVSGAPRRLEVADTGIGIASQDRQRVFEAFEQASPQTAARFGGTGLGLSISRAICDALEFELTVESTLGEGSTFRVRFGT